MTCVALLTVFLLMFSKKPYVFLFIWDHHSATSNALFHRLWHWRPPHTDNTIQRQRIHWLINSWSMCRICILTHLLSTWVWWIYITSLTFQAWIQIIHTWFIIHRSIETSFDHHIIIHFYQVVWSTEHDAEGSEVLRTLRDVWVTRLCRVVVWLSLHQKIPFTGIKCFSRPTILIRILTVDKVRTRVSSWF